MEANDLQRLLLANDEKQSDGKQNRPIAIATVVSRGSTRFPRSGCEIRWWRIAKAQLWPQILTSSSIVLSNAVRPGHSCHSIAATRSPSSNATTAPTQLQSSPQPRKMPSSESGGPPRTASTSPRVMPTSMRSNAFVHARLRQPQSTTGATQTATPASKPSISQRLIRIACPQTQSQGSRKKTQTTQKIPVPNRLFCDFFAFFRGDSPLTSFVAATRSTLPPFARRFRCYRRGSGPTVSAMRRACQGLSPEMRRGHAAVITEQNSRLASPFGVHPHRVIRLPAASTPKRRIQ